MSDSEHGIFENLRGPVCACSEAKRSGRSFCASCYFRLPKSLRNALYTGNGYVESYRAALRYLGLSEPKKAAPGPRRSLTQLLSDRRRAKRLGLPQP